MSITKKLWEDNFEITQQEERIKKELDHIKGTLDKSRKKLDINIAIYNDEA